jgi:hypothetical protein
MGLVIAVVFDRNEPMKIAWSWCVNREITKLEGVSLRKRSFRTPEMREQGGADVRGRVLAASWYDEWPAWMAKRPGRTAVRG